jgi:hypothetical protein
VHVWTRRGQIRDDDRRRFSSIERESRAKPKIRTRGTRGSYVASNGRASVNIPVTDCNIAPRVQGNPTAAGL